MSTYFNLADYNSYIIYCFEHADAKIFKEYDFLPFFEYHNINFDQQSMQLEQYLKTHIEQWQQHLIYIYNSLTQSGGDIDENINWLKQDIANIIIRTREMKECLGFEFNLISNMINIATYSYPVDETLNCTDAIYQITNSSYVLFASTSLLLSDLSPLPEFLMSLYGIDIVEVKLIWLDFINDILSTIIYDIDNNLCQYTKSALTF